MGWPQARDALNASIKALTPTTLERGAGRFRYDDRATRENPPDTRGFWWEFVGAVTRNIIRIGGNWERYTCDLVVSYRKDVEPAKRMEIMAADRKLLSQVLFLPANWSQSTSTILLVSHEGDDTLLPTRWDATDGGGVLMSLRAVVEFQN